MRIILSVLGFAFFAHSAWCATDLKERDSLPIYNNNNNNNNAYYGTAGNSNYDFFFGTIASSPTLNQLYGGGAQTVFSLNFAEQPNRWDPYNRLKQSEFIWRFADTNDTVQADNAFIDVSGSSTPYQQSSNNYKSTAALLSAPLQRWQSLNATTTNPTELTVNPYNEGVLKWKSSVTITATQRVVLRFKMGCKVLDAEKHPFPAELVSRPDDDPRFANCYIALVPVSENVTSDIYVIIINKSIWAVYETATSISKRRIGSRQSYNDIVDIGLEYNAVENQYTFYVSGQPKWVITQPGMTPPQDGVTKTDTLLTGGPGVAENQGREFIFRFGTHKCLDESDPSNQAGTIRLVRNQANPAYYGDAMFYDNANLRSNNLWGQTVKMTLDKVVIKTASAVVQSMQPAGQSSSSPSAYEDVADADNGGGDDDAVNDDYQSAGSSANSYNWK